MGRKQGYFPKVAEARQLLADKAREIINMQFMIIASALAAGDFETAANANQWLIEHMPAAEGPQLVDISVDKPKSITGSSGPTIQIGFKLGGVDNPPLALPEAATVIDAEPTTDSSE